MPRWEQVKSVPQCDVRKCFNPAEIAVEGGYLLCGHHERGTRVKRYVCKFCKIPVVSQADTRAVLGKEHKKCCPRHKKDI